MSEHEDEDMTGDESEAIDLDSDEDDEEEEKQTAQPYMSLMRSLVESAPHKAKRRKLDHSQAEDMEAPRAEATPEPAQNEGEDEGVGGQRDVDLVEEPEESPADAAPEDLFDEDDDLDSSDPFEAHFTEPNVDEVQLRLRAIQASNWRMDRTLTKSTRVFLQTPDVESTDAKALLAPISAISELKLKKRLQESMAPKHAKLDQVEQTIAPLLFNYQDLLYCNRTVSESQGIRRMACLHALNHIFKCVHERTVYGNLG